MVKPLLCFVMTLDVKCELFFLVAMLGEEIVYGSAAGDNEQEVCQEKFKKLILFSGNDYLGLSSHPTIGKAASKVCFMNFE